MLSRPHTMMVIWLATSVLVLPEELSAVEQQSVAPGLGKNCSVKGGFETSAAKAATGCECKISPGGSPLKFEGVVETPAFATDATVFLSGWDFDYPSTDHKLAHIEVRIDNITRDVQTLRWEATGILRDTNWDDAFRLCYYYTVLAWDRRQFTEAFVADDSKFLVNGIVHKDSATATTVLPSYAEVPEAPGVSVAILPRGFSFSWGDKNPNDPAADIPDNNLLQLAYALTHRERFIKPEAYAGMPPPHILEPVPQISSLYISWESHGILKDDERAREYHFGEFFSVLNGADVHVVQPPFTILPVEDDEGISTCVSTGPGKVESKQYEIANIPYSVAVPVLTGWDLSFHCSDEHVGEIGVWLSDWQYEKPPNFPLGRLRYTVSYLLMDKNNKPGFNFRHKVDVVGLVLP